MRWRSFCGLFLLLTLANHALLAGLAQARPGQLTEWLLQGKAGDAEVLLLGSSAAHRGFDANLLRELLGAPVVDLSSIGAAYPEQRLILDLYLRRHRAKTLIFEVDTWGLSSTSYSYPFHEYLYLPHLGQPAIRDHLTSRYGAWRIFLWRWLPMYKFSEFNLQIGLAPSLNDLRRGAPYHPGTDHLLDRSLTSLDRESDEQKVPRAYDRSPIRQQGFEGILNLAQKHSLRVLLVLAPVHRSAFAQEPDRQQVIDFYHAVARRDGLALLTPTEPLISDPSYFFDPFHLNRSGAAVLTRSLAATLLTKSATTQGCTAAEGTAVDDTAADDTAAESPLPKMPRCGQPGPAKVSRSRLAAIR
jgi:hypothetical protein